MEIEVLKRKLDELVASNDVVKQEKVNWGVWMASVITQVSNNWWAEFQERSLSFMREFVTPTVRTTMCATTTANNSASIVTSAPLFVPTISPIACSARTTVVSGTVMSTYASNPSAQPTPLYGGDQFAYGYGQGQGQTYHAAFPGYGGMSSQQQYGGPYPGGSGQYGQSVPALPQSHEQLYPPLTMPTVPNIPPGVFPAPASKQVSSPKLARYLYQSWQLLLPLVNSLFFLLINYTRTPFN